MHSGPWCALGRALAALACLALLGGLALPAAAQTTCAEPDLAGRTQIWSQALTVGSGMSVAQTVYGYQNSRGESTGSLVDTDFTVGMTSYTIDELFVVGGSGTSAGTLAFSLTDALANADRSDLVLHVCDQAFDLDDAQYAAADHIYHWAMSGLDWSSETSRTLYLSTRTPNTAATGAPSISGTAAVGETLAASAAGIADTNGKTKADGGETGYAYTYQWFRVDGSSVETPVSGATGSSYVVQAADVDHTILVKVSFTDDSDYPEGPLTSAATATVVVLPALSVADVTVAEAANASATFTVTLSETATQNISVDWAASTEADDTATAGSDYTADSGTVTIATASDSATFDVPILQDLIDEPNETFTVTLSSVVPGGTAVIATAKATGTIADDDAEPSLEFHVTSTTLDETGSGASRTIAWVQLPSGSTYYAEPQAITFELSGTATEEIDYTVTGKSGTYPAGTSGIVPLEATAIDDRIDEGDETIVVTAFRNRVRIGTAQTVTLSDDDPEPSLELSVDPDAIDEDGGVSTVTVSTGTGSTFEQSRTVTLATSGTATRGSDYSIGTLTLTLPAGVGDQPSEVQTTVTGRDDNLDDDDETIVIQGSRSSVDFGVAQTVTITDDEETVSVEPATVAEDDGMATFTVRLSAALGDDVTVSWAASAAAGDTATANSDFTAANGTVTINASDDSATFDVPISNDNLYEGSETFTVTLTGVTSVGPALLGTVTATGTITDDEVAPVLSLSVNQSAIGENGGTATVTVSTGSGSTYPSQQTITLVLGGTATASDDYTLATTLTLAAGATQAEATLTAVNDGIDDDAETITIAGRIGSDPFGTTRTVTITDDDAAPVLQFSANPLSIGENARTSTVTVSTDTGSTFSEDQTITLTLGGTATLTGDYTIDSTSLTLPAGVGNTASQVTATVTAVEDTADEDNETITIDASRGGNPVGTRQTITVTDNDNPPAVNIADANTTEGGTLSFIVTVVPVSGKTVTVDWATSIGASDTAEVADFTPVASTTLTFDPGVASQTVSVTTLEDTTDEDNDTFTVTLTLPAGANATLGDATATGTIADDDDPPVVRIADQSVPETSGDSVRVTLSQPSEKTVTVLIAYTTATGDTATAGADYTSRSQTFRFEPGDAAGDAASFVSPDDLDEVEETYTATLSGPVNATLDPNATRARITILDDDDPPSVGIAAAEDDEGDAIEFTVTLGAPSGRELTVDWETSVEVGDTAAQADFAAASDTLTYAAGERTKTFAVDTVEDTADEDHETFTVTLSNPEHVTLDVDATSAKGTIRNDDPDPVVTLALGPASIRESDDTGTPGDQHVSTVTATIDRPSGADTTITVAAAPVMPAEAEDIELSVDTTLTIPAGETSSTGTVTVSAVDNDVDAPNRTFTISATAVNTLGIDDPEDETLTVVDEDPAPVATLILDSTSIRESDDPNQPENEHETTVSVELDRPSSHETTVTLTVSDAFTVTGNGRLTVLAGAKESTGSVTLTAVDNNTDAPDRVVKVTATADNDQGVTQPQGKDLTIEDEDPEPTVTLELLSDTISENGGSTTVKAVLSHPSSDPTTVTVSVTDTVARAAQSTLTGAVLTIPASVVESSGAATITAQDNDTDAPDQMVEVSATAANSQGIAGDPGALTLTITDDEAAPTVTLALSSNPIPEENGVAEVTATLSHPSSEPTTVTVSTEAVAPAVAEDLAQSGSVLTVLEGQTSSVRLVSVTAVPNRVDAPDKQVTVSAEAVNTQGVAGHPAALRLTIRDDDERGFVWVPESLTVRERQFPSPSYTVALASEPTATVTVTIRSRNREILKVAEGSVFGDGVGSVHELTFTPQDWSEPRTMTLLAGDAPDATVSIRHTASGGDYALTRDYRVTILDVDAPTQKVLLSVNPTRVAEGDGATSVTVTATLDGAPLTSAVGVAVTIAGGTAEASDFTVGSSSFTLTIPASTGFASSVVSFTPVDDELAEADETVTVSGTTTATAQGTSTPLAVTSATVTIEDNEARGVTVSDTVLEVDEDAGATYTVTLDTRPTDTVTVTPTVTGNADVTVSPPSLDFTTVSWNQPQTVTVTAADDGDPVDDTATVNHAVSGADYGENNVAAASVAVRVTDDDQRAVRLSQDRIEVDEGSGTTYTVELASRPTGTVTVRPRVSNNPDVTVSPPSLPFTPASWDQPQTVTVEAVEDGDNLPDLATVTHAVSGADYSANNVVGPDLAVEVRDLVTTDSITLSVSEPRVSEAGRANYVFVTATLEGAPRDVPTPVTVQVAGGTADATDFSAEPAAFDITISRGHTENRGGFTLHITQDSLDEGTGETVVVSGTSPGLDVTSAEIFIADDDGIGFRLSAKKLNVNEEGSATYTVALATVPSGAVTVMPTVTDNSDVTISPPSLDFTVTDWNVAQTVTVSAAEDADGDNETATIEHRASGADYDGHSSGTVSVNVQDIDRTSQTVQLTVAPEEVSEDAGRTAVTVTAKLDGAARAAPTVVTVTVSGATADAEDDFAEVADFAITIPADVTEASRSFDLSPVNDDLDEGTGETVTVGGAVATGTGLTVRSATLTIADDDTRGIEVPPGPLAVTEDGGAATYTVALATQPTGTVMVQVQVIGNPDVTVDPPELTFTQDDWAVAQTVEVEAAHDDDGQDDTAELRHTASGADYAGVRGDTLDVTVTDDDARGVEVSKQDLTFREGDSDTYTVRLETRPTDTVTVTPEVEGDIDVTVSPPRLTFTTSNWSTPKTVTVHSRPDFDSDVDEATVTHEVTGADYGEYRITASPVAVTVTDKDVPSTAIYLKVSADSVREDAGARTLTVTATLNAAPRRTDTEVELRLEADTAQAVTDFAEVNPVTLTIDAGSPSGTAQIVLTPVGDDVDEEDETVRIAASTDSGLAFSPASLEVTIEDDDERGLRVSRRTLTVTENASATYTVRLESAPTGTVTVTPSVTDNPDVTVAPLTLTFTAANWSTAQTVTVEADDDLDGDRETATIEHRASGADYHGETAPAVEVDVRDDDSRSRAVALEVEPDEVIEDGGAQSVTVTATLDGAVRAVETVVTVTLSAGTASASDFEQPQPSITVTIPAQEKAAATTFRFEPVEDFVDENAETVRVRGTVTGLRVDSTELTIDDDDEKGLVLRPQSLEFGEGGSVVYTVTLASRPTGTVTVDIHRTGSSKVVVAPTRLTFRPDDWNVAQEVEVEAARDRDDDVEEAELSHRASGADYRGVTAPSPLKVTVVERGVCHRGSAVRNALMEVALRHLISPPHRGSCDVVTDEMLAKVPHLTVDEKRFGALTSLSPGDFAGLTGVRELWIYGHKGLTELPAGIFHELESLEELRIWPGLPPDSSGGLEEVSAGAFRGLAKLRVLDLRGNDLTSLAPGTFDGLVALETLDVQDNELTSLPLDELEALPRLGKGGRWSGIWGARGFTPGVQLSRAAVTVAAGGSATYRVRLLTPPDYIVGPSGGKRLVHGVVRVSAPTGVTVDNDGLTFTDQDWFRRQTVTVSVDAGATSGVKELAHTVDGPYLRVGVRDSATPYPVVLSVTVTGGAQAQVAAPAVTGVPSVTGPAADGAYAQSERIEARVTFDTPVTVDTTGGAPALGLSLGGVRRDASYESGSGTDTLVFGHTVTAGDAGAEAAKALANGVRLNGATIRGADGTDAVLDYGSAPGVTGVEVADAPGGDGRWDPGDAVAVRFTFAEPVVVDTTRGVPTVGLELGGARIAVYVRGSGTATLVFARTLGPSESRQTFLRVAPNGLALNGGTIRSTGGLDAALAHDAVGRSGMGGVPVGNALPVLEVADAQAREGETLVFRVTLAPAPTGTVTVAYTTVDGSAVAGEDYETEAETLTFAATETEKTVEVTTLADGHDDDGETLALTLTEPQGATIGDGEATGTITNTGAMPRAWLARFGRTVAEQVLGAVEARMAASRTPGVEVSVAGQRLEAATPEQHEAYEARMRLEARPRQVRGESEESGQVETRELTGRDFVTGSSFTLSEGSAEDGFATVWGRGAVTSFDGREDDLVLDGEVVSGVLGAEWTREDVMAGLVVAHSRGEGEYRGSGEGEVESTLTGLYPWGRVALSERMSVWGVVGYGAGELTLVPAGQAPLEAEMDLLMVAAGVRGVVVEAPSDGGVELAVVADGLGVRTASDSVSGPAGTLMGAEGDVLRLRLGLTGQWRGVELGSGRLEPSVELGVRHDSGDAETGFGADVGAGVVWTDPERGLEVQARARGLLTHEDGQFGEHGFAGGVTWDARPGTERGMRLTVQQTVGAPATGGKDSLLARRTMEGLAANGEGDDLGPRRLEVKLGYGLPAFDSLFIATPEVGIELSDTEREYRLGLRLAGTGYARGGLGLAGSGGAACELTLEATQRERADGDRAPEHAIGLRLTARW